MDPLPHVLPAGVHPASLGISTTSPKWNALVTDDPELQVPYSLLGCPFDGGIPTRPGARFGPDAIRAQWYRLGLLHGETGLPLTPLICDRGNVEVVGTTAAMTHSRLESSWQAILTSQPNVFPITLGGDHGLTAPAFLGYQRFHEHQLGLIVFDAHFDVREWTPDSLSSGTPFRRILDAGAGALAGRNLVYIGIRPFANSPHYLEYVREQGATIFDMATLHRRGIDRVMQEAIDIASQGTEGIWVSLDIDVMDQGDAPGASATGPGGMRSGDLLVAMEKLGSSGAVCALDVMEVSPPLDFQEMTSRLAAHAIATFIHCRESLDRPSRGLETELRHEQ